MSLRLDPVSLATLQAGGLRWRSEEAIALVVRLGQLLRWRDAPPGPGAVWVLADGTVVLSEPGGSPATAAPYARLLHALLPEPDAGQSSRVPGRVRILVARALGQTALPPLESAEQFGAQLDTVAPEQPALVLAGLVARWRGTELGLDASVASPDALPYLRTSHRRRRPGLVLTLLGVTVLTAVVGLNIGRMVARRHAAQATTGAVDRGSAAPGDARNAEVPAGERSARPRATSGSPREERFAQRAWAGPAAQAGFVPVALRDARTYSPSFGSTAGTLFFHAEHADGTRLMSVRTDADGHPIELGVVLRDDARNFHARISPDGRRLAYDSDRDGERGVYVRLVNGGRAERVSGPGYAAVPTWSPDGLQLAFVRGEPDRPRVWNLWVVDLRSGALRRLTRYRVGQVWPGNWLEDGRRLVYTHETRVSVLDTVSRTTRSFRTPIPGRLVRTASVSSDGRRVAFQVYRDGLWGLDLTTGRMTRWLADPSAEEFAWSPDDSRLAFHSRRGGRWSVWTMPAPAM